MLPLEDLKKKPLHFILEVLLEKGNTIKECLLNISLFYSRNNEKTKACPSQWI